MIALPKQFNRCVNAIEIFEKSFGRAESLLKLHKKAQPKGRPSMGGVADDILRATIIFASAALDSYLHKRIEEVALRILKDQKRMPFKVYAPILKMVPNKRTGNSASIDVSSQERDIPIAKYFFELGYNSTPNKIVGQIARNLQGDTFQNAAQVDRALDFMDVSKTDRWNLIRSKMRSKHAPIKYKKGLNPKQFLDDLYGERSRIVHEGGVYISKKHHGQLRAITRTHIDITLRKLRRIILALEAVTK